MLFNGAPSGEVTDVDSRINILVFRDIHTDTDVGKCLLWV